MRASYIASEGLRRVVQLMPAHINKITASIMLNFVGAGVAARWACRLVENPSTLAEDWNVQYSDINN